MIFLIDASSLIAFYSEDELNEPELLHELTKRKHRLIIPPAVFEEIKNGHTATFAILSRAIEERKVEVENSISSDEVSRFRKRHPLLHDGEIQVLLLGLKLKTDGTPYYCVVDEGPGRNVAEKNGIALKGTKGLLIMLHEIGVIDRNRKESLLYRLDHCNFRL